MFYPPIVYGPYAGLLGLKIVQFGIHFFFLPTSHDYYTVHTDKTRPKPHPKYSSSFFSFSFLLSLSIPFPCTFK